MQRIKSSLGVSMVIYAWVGEDEFGSGEIGLKQGVVPAGVIPLAAMGHHYDRVAKLLPQMEIQATMHGKKISLCKFVFAEVVTETKAGR
jgi:hypothetical protein